MVQNSTEADLRKEEAKINLNKIKENIKNIKEDKNSKQTGIWKVKNGFFPKQQTTLPTAKTNIDGQIITGHKELKNLYLEHFHHRLRFRPIRPGLEWYLKKINDEFKVTLEKTACNKFQDWTEDDLQKVLKSLKKSQCADSLGLVNELFINAGGDLRRSILMLCNNIKNNCRLPEFMKNVQISSIPKKKKSPMSLKSERGIFLSPKLKAILMKLVHNSIIDQIEENLSSSNIGARKGKSPRDHLFVVYAVINDIKNGKKKEPVDIVCYDVEQCYDALWLEHTLLDVHKSGIDSNLLNLIYEASRKAKIAVKSPVGVSEAKEIEDQVMQGETLSSILCTNTMDKISTDCPIKPFKYREKISIPKLGFVDDLFDIQKCKKFTKLVNVYTNEEISKRKLQLSKDKCKRMHISPKSSKNIHSCDELLIDNWSVIITKSEGQPSKLIDLYNQQVVIQSVDSMDYLGDWYLVMRQVL